MAVRAYTAEGFPLPTIKEWNSGVTQIVEEMKKRTGSVSRESVFKGAVDDLETSNCGYCGNEMIRQFEGYLGPFNNGIVYCPEAQNDTNHPAEFWYELWPYTGEKRLPVLGSNLTIEEHNERGFRLSNPIIKKCYTGGSIRWHQHVGLDGEGDDRGLTYFPEGRTTSLPKPNYTHK